MQYQIYLLTYDNFLTNFIKEKKAVRSKDGSLFYVHGRQ